MRAITPLRTAGFWQAVAAVGSQDEINAPQRRVVSSPIRSLLIAGFHRAA